MISVKIILQTINVHNSSWKNLNSKGNHTILKGIVLTASFPNDTFINEYKKVQLLYLLNIFYMDLRQR